MGVVARIKKDGSFLTNGEINERLPVITDGLVSYYPLDSKAGGIDIIGLNGTVQNLEQGINYLDTLNNGGWRNPSNWTIPCSWDESKQAIKIVGNKNGYLKIPVIIDTAKHYEIQMSVYVESYTGSGGLYLGGMGWDITGTQVTTNWMYFLALNHDYPSLVGKWTTFRTTLSGTGALPYLNNYSFPIYPAKNGGWSENGRTTYKYKYGGLFNYQSTGGTIYVKDCIVRTVDPDTSNTVESNNGIAIQDATTNLVTFHTRDFGSWGGLTGSTSYFTAPNGRQGITLMAGNSGGVQWTHSNNITATSGTIYTVSCKVKATNWSSVSVNLFYIRQYNPTGQTSENGIYTNTNRVKLDNGFYYTWASFTTASNVNRFAIESYQYSSGMIWIYDLQCQRLTYPLEYVGNGISKANSILKLPLPVTTFPFTVSVNIRNLLHNGQNGEIGETNVGYPISWWTVSGGYKGVLGQFSRSNNAFLKNNFRATLICRSTTYSLYFDDVLASSGNYYNDTPSPFTTPISLGSRHNEEGSGRFNGIYSDCSIYNRELSITEIKNLMSNELKLASNYTITDNIIESPSILDEGFYFPLSTDTKDIYKTVSAYTESNVLYEDSSIYVGTSTTNLIPQTGNYTIVGSGTVPAIIKSSNLVLYSHDYNENIANSAYHGYDIPIISGSTYTYSMDAVISKNFNYTGTTTFAGNCEQGFSANYQYNMLDKGKWKRFTTSKLSTGANARPLFYPNSTYSDNGKIYYKNWMLVNKSYRPCFCTGTSGNGNLTYNFNRDIGLSWAGNWSICYWKKPVATASNNFVGYNIESLGCNNNSVGGGYRWWGKNSGVNEITGAGLFTPSDYFDKWQFISMVKTGTSITVKTILDNGVVYNLITSTTNSVANYYVTQYGYDFELGGFDNANPTNTYFRDLIVVKRALTDSEVTSIYKQFNVTKYNTFTQNLIEEGI